MIGFLKQYALNMGVQLNIHQFNKDGFRVKQKLALKIYLQRNFLDGLLQSKDVKNNKLRRIMWWLKTNRC